MSFCSFSDEKNKAGFSLKKIEKLKKINKIWIPHQIFPSSLPSERGSKGREIKLSFWWGYGRMG
jgi:hypothetical protein